ncbi:MAG: DUF4275 family protein [Clostridia bacterium]|nr:DUF4275 family protein [Clostridia bacterium]
MKTVRYCEWEIEVDIEKTKSYYADFVVDESQANRNFREYCKIMNDDEKAFFESFGINAECCNAIQHIGVNKKKEFPCGGHYLICGRYLRCPKEEVISVDELVENDFVDERPDPRINIGLFEFDFQCEDHTFSDIPDDIPEGFICVRFWCENMRWLLNEKPEDDMVMYEFPRWWEIGRIIKESLAAKKQGMLDLEERKQEFKTAFEKLGIKHSELNGKEVRKYRQSWVDKFSPDGSNKKEIKKICSSTRTGGAFLWHIFSYEIICPEEAPNECYNSTCKDNCILISNLDEIGFTLTDADKLTSEVISEFTDVTVFDEEMTWTYCKTHESMCGPYYYKK